MVSNCKIFGLCLLVLGFRVEAAEWVVEFLDDDNKENMILESQKEADAYLDNNGLVAIEDCDGHYGAVKKDSLEEITDSTDYDNLPAYDKHVYEYVSYRRGIKTKGYKIYKYGNSIAVLNDKYDWTGVTTKIGHHPRGCFIDDNFRTGSDYKYLLVGASSWFYNENVVLAEDSRKALEDKYNELNPPVDEKSPSKSGCCKSCKSCKR